MGFVIVPVVLRNKDERRKTGERERNERKGLRKEEP